VSKAKTRTVFDPPLETAGDVQRAVAELHPDQAVKFEVTMNGRVKAITVTGKQTP
jgi:hypothetical protein